MNLRRFNYETAKKITDLIGNTPLLELVNIQDSERLQAKILAKLELFNPAGSVKDRIAKAMTRMPKLMAF